MDIEYKVCMHTVIPSKYTNKTTRGNKIIFTFRWKLKYLYLMTEGINRQKIHKYMYLNKTELWSPNLCQQF